MCIIVIVLDDISPKDATIVGSVVTVPPGKYCSLKKQETEKGCSSCLSLRFTAAGKALLPARDHSAAGSATCFCCLYHCGCCYNHLLLTAAATATALLLPPLL
jgi:hypothetical protein